MRVRKIITKNFIEPGMQSFIFDENNILSSGEYQNKFDINILKYLLNGGWINHTLSFQKYYPLFERKTSDMNFEIDALIELNNREFKLLNFYLQEEGHHNFKSKAFYYQIKCVWPYLFPIVRLKPAEFKNEVPIIFGNHYDKFFKHIISKNEAIDITTLSAVGKFRELYYEYNSITINKIKLSQHLEYLKIIKSLFIDTEKFNKQMRDIAFKISDTDILENASSKEFFSRNEFVNEWLDSYELFKNEPNFRTDFMDLMWDYFFRDLQYLYKFRTASESVDILKLLLPFNTSDNVNFKIFSDSTEFELIEPKNEVLLDIKIKQEEKKIREMESIKQEYEQILRTQEDIILHQSKEIENTKDDLNNLEDIKIPKRKMKILKLEARNSLIKGFRDKRRNEKIRLKNKNFIEKPDINIREGDYE